MRVRTLFVGVCRKSELIPNRSERKRESNWLGAQHRECIRKNRPNATVADVRVEQNFTEGDGSSNLSLLRSIWKIRPMEASIRSNAQNQIEFVSFDVSRFHGPMPQSFWCSLILAFSEKNWDFLRCSGCSGAIHSPSPTEPS